MDAVHLASPAEQQLAEQPSGFTPPELESFQRDGYIVVRQLASQPFRDTMRAVTLDHLERQVAPVEYEADLQYPGAPPSRNAQGGRTIRRLKQAHSRHVAFTEWLAMPQLVLRLHQLLGAPVVCPLAHHNCIMTKSPLYSSDTGWHQDIRYWSFHKPELISVWLALGPENVDNGCLKLIPGTHLGPFERARLDDQLFLRDDLPENRALISQSVPAELEPGDALFFHCRTFHSASRNHTQQAKLSVVFTFRPADNPPLPGSRSASLPELLLPPLSA